MELGRAWDPQKRGEGSCGQKGASSLAPGEIRTGTGSEEPGVTQTEEEKLL